MPLVRHLLIVAACLCGAVAQAADPPPMPQTRGMQGMDPAAHERWAKEGEGAPRTGCTPNAEKVKRQAEHPMPETKGMKGMDPKMHTEDCPEPEVEKPDPDKPPRHVHKAPG